MATIIVEVRAILDESNVVELLLTRDGQSVEMTAIRNWTLEQLAAEIVEQEMPGEPDRTFQRLLTIEAHQETGIDPETGEEYLFWVVDSVESEQLTDEAAKNGFEALPGWATWSADEAEQWMLDNVTDLASAQLALSQMARAIAFLRDWR